MKWKRDQRENRSVTNFKVGDLVYHTRDYYGNSPEQKGLSKLLGRFRGPDPIVKVLGPNTFEVEVGPNKVLTFSPCQRKKRKLALEKWWDLIYRLELGAWRGQVGRQTEGCRGATCGAHNWLID